MNIAQELKEMLIIKLNVYADEVIPQARIMDDLGADSLDFVELLMAAEEKFDFEINDEEAEKIITVQDAIDFIKAAQK